MRGVEYYSTQQMKRYSGQFALFNSKPLRHGFGQAKYKNGDNFVGKWKQGKRCGFGLLTKIDAIEPISGLWSDDKFVDNCTSTNDDVFEDMLHPLRLSSEKCFSRRLRADYGTAYAMCDGSIKDFVKFVTSCRPCHSLEYEIYMFASDKRARLAPPGGP